MSSVTRVRGRDGPSRAGSDLSGTTCSPQGLHRPKYYIPEIALIYEGAERKQGGPGASLSGTTKTKRAYCFGRYLLVTEPLIAQVNPPAPQVPV